MKWIYLILITAFIIRASEAQEVSLNLPVLEGFFDAAIQVVELPAGGYILSTPNGCREDAPTTNCAGLLRVNTQGEVLWSKVFDGGTANAVTPAQFGMVLINDTIYTANLISQGNQQQARFMALNLEGQLLYQQDLAIPHTSSLFLDGMLEDEGKFLVYGRAKNNGSRKVFIRVLDLHFNLMQESLLGNPGISKHAAQLNKTEDGGYILAYAEGMFTAVSLVVVKLNAGLEVEYSKPILESGENFGFVNVFETTDEGFMVAWQNDLSESLSDTFPYPTAVYKLDSLANVEWEYVFANRAEKSHASAVKVEGDKMLGVGITDYFYLEVDPDRGIDSWCFLIDASGELLWERSISDVRESYGCRLWHGLESEGGFVLVGDIDKKNPSGEPFLNDPDVWFLTLDENGCWNGNCEEHIIITGDNTSITDTESPALPSEELTLYPNPTSGILNIEYTDALMSSSRRIVVTNAGGEKMLEMSFKLPP